MRDSCQIFYQKAWFLLRLIGKDFLKPREMLAFFPFGFIDALFISRMDGNGKRLFLFPLNLCSPPLRPRRLIGTLLLSTYLHISLSTGR